MRLLVSQVEDVSRYWELTGGVGMGYKRRGTKRVHMREGSWVCHERLWSPPGMGEEKKDSLVRVFCCGAGD